MKWTECNVTVIMLIMSLNPFWTFLGLRGGCCFSAKTPQRLFFKRNNEVFVRSGGH